MGFIFQASICYQLSQQTRWANRLHFLEIFFCLSSFLIYCNIFWSVVRLPTELWYHSVVHTVEHCSNTFCKIVISYHIFQNVIFDLQCTQKNVCEQLACVVEYHSEANAMWLWMCMHMIFSIWLCSELVVNTLISRMRVWWVLELDDDGATDPTAWSHPNTQQPAI